MNAFQEGQCESVRCIAHLYHSSHLRQQSYGVLGKTGGLALAGFSLSLRFGFLDELQTTAVGSDGTFYDLLCLKQTKA